MKSKIYDSAAAALEGVVFDGLTLIELAPGVTLDEVKAKTQADFNPGAFA